MTVKPYEQCVTRLENRGSHPPTKEYVDNLVEALEATGVEASWHSAVDPHGMPLFPSKVYPRCHPDANFESFGYLLDRLHGIGRPVLSWYPLNHSSAVCLEHPDWKMQFMPLEPHAYYVVKAESYHCCFNSPYGELLPKFAAEIVRDVGFDGIWFDGSTMSHGATDPSFHPACVCAFCKERFFRDTGCDLPEKIDYEDRTFRVWVNWRYDILAEMWQRATNAVIAVKPDATVCFNNYRRRHNSAYPWGTGIPMRRLAMDALMSCELDLFPTQADFQNKHNRAYGCTRGVDTWWPLMDHAHCWVPDVDPLTATQAMIAGMSAGGGICCGVGVDARLVAPALQAMQKAGKSLLPYRDGNTLEYAAIWCSQSTQDFYYKGNGEWAYNEMHGANELCLHAHLQSSIVFDDHVARGELGRYPVLLAPNVACMTSQQADRLRTYVEAGGILFATQDTGCCDELGYPHDTPVLDKLLGITAREVAKGSPTLELIDDDLKQVTDPWISFTAKMTNPTCANDVQLLAHAVVRTASSWDGIETGAPPFERVPGLWQRQVGKGWVIYAGFELFHAHLTQPMKRTVKLFKRLVTRLAPPAVTADAPLCVTLNARRLPDDRVAIVLHNAPGTTYRYPAPPRQNFLNAPGEVVPLFDLAVHLNGLPCRRAYSGITQEPLEIRDQHTILVPRLDLHEVVVVEG